jgi:hypothetical protein
MKVVSVFGIAVMELYKDAIRSDPKAAEVRKYLVGVNNPSGAAFLWAEGCSNHEEALSLRMAELAADNEHVEYAVVGPCNDGCRCGETRGKTYFTVRG